MDFSMEISGNVPTLKSNRLLVREIKINVQQRTSRANQIEGSGQMLPNARAFLGCEICNVFSRDI